MRLLFALTICILALALGQKAAAREMAGLRRLSAESPETTTTTPASASTRSGAAAASKTSLPEITLYGESFCPDTAQFVSQILGPMLDAGAIDTSDGKTGSAAGKSSSKATSSNSAAAAPSPLSTPAVQSSPPLASQPGGGFLSAHSGGPAPTELSASKPLTLASGGSAGTVTINSAAAAASENTDTPTAAATFRFVPWGKAKFAADGKITCQHGPKECELNKLLGCAQAKQASAAKFTSTLRCYFGALGKSGGGTPASLERCVGDEAAYAKIAACASGAEGAALEAAAGKETEKQRLSFVPWVLVDSTALGAECGSALRVACEKAKAKGLSPSSCSRIPELTVEGCPGAP